MSLETRHSAEVTKPTFMIALDRIVGLRAQAVAHLHHTIDDLSCELEQRNEQAPRYTVDHYSRRTFQVQEGEELVAVTVYKKGAHEIKRRLEGKDAEIARWHSMAIALVTCLDRRHER